jgi:hypothetical protein
MSPRKKARRGGALSGEFPEGVRMRTPKQLPLKLPQARPLTKACAVVDRPARNYCARVDAALRTIATDPAIAESAAERAHELREARAAVRARQ